MQAEARAEFAEKTVKKLQKEVDRLEGLLSDPCFIIITYYYLSTTCLCLDCCTTTCTTLLGDNRRDPLNISPCSYCFLKLFTPVRHFSSTSRFNLYLLFTVSVLLKNIQINILTNEISVSVIIYYCTRYQKYLFGV